jgi:hypothetical protein
MTIVASGEGAAYLDAQLQVDGSWALVLTAIPTSPAFLLALTEDQSGYSNTPHETDFALSYSGPLSPIMGLIASLDDRTVTISRTSSTPPRWEAPFDPSDNAPYVFALASFLGDSELDTLIGAKVSVMAAGLGVEIDSGIRRPIVDQTNKCIALWFKVADAFQGTSYFVSPVAALISIRFTTVGTDDAPAETYERSAYLTVQQL